MSAFADLRAILVQFRFLEVEALLVAVERMGRNSEGGQAVSVDYARGWNEAMAAVQLALGKRAEELEADRS